MIIVTSGFVSQFKNVNEALVQGLSIQSLEFKPIRLQMIDTE